MIQSLDANGTVREWEVINLLDANGTLRVVDTILMLDANGTVREAYSSAAAPAPTGAYITPESSSTSSPNSSSYTAAFTANHDGAATYAWGVTGGTIVSGGMSKTAQVRVTALSGEPAFASIWCDVTIAGATTRAYATMEHAYNPSGPSGQPGLVQQ